MSSAAHRRQGPDGRLILDNISRALKEQNWLAAGIDFVPPLLINAVPCQ